MKIGFDYLKLFLFAAGILLGLQVPGFVEQYGSRLESRLLESELSLQAFKADADKYFDGDILRLIVHYKDNADPVVQDGGRNIEALYLRNQELAAAYQHFSHNSFSPFIHTLVQPLKEVRDNTLKSYNFVVLLNKSSVVWGIALGFLLISVYNLFFGFLRVLFRMLTKRPTLQKSQ